MKIRETPGRKSKKSRKFLKENPVKVTKNSENLHKSS